MVNLLVNNSDAFLTHDNDVTFFSDGKVLQRTVRGNRVPGSMCMFSTTSFATTGSDAI